MNKFIRNNAVYFVLFLLFVLTGGYYLSEAEKAAAILFFNQNRHPFLDDFFKITTLFGEGWLYLLTVVVAMAVRLRHALLLSLTGFLVLGSSLLLKSIFREERPLSYFRRLGIADQLQLVEGVDIHTGATSLPSGHTMAAFALYGLLAFLLPGRRYTAVLLFTVALGVGISRIYLIQHFWMDVYWGAIAGTMLAIMMYHLNFRLSRAPGHWLEKPAFRLPLPGRSKS
jgi:membrane-associated phospholipid phosphatase